MPQSYEIDPSLLAALGKIVTQWAWIEESLGQLLAHLLAADRAATYVITQNVSDSTITDWIRTLLSIRGVQQEDADALEQILEESNRLRAERNRLAHGLWRNGPVPGTALIHTIRPWNSEIMMDTLITEPDLQDIIVALCHLSTQFVRIGRYFGYLPRQPPLGN